MEHSKSNKIDHQQHIEESAEWILENRAGWTAFTTWAREKYHINNRQANDLWKEAWAVLNEQFEDNIKQSINETLLSLEQIELAAMEEEDRRIWLEVVKYRNKIRGGEIERAEVKVTGNVNVTLSWGDQQDPGDEHTTV